MSWEGWTIENGWLTVIEFRISFCWQKFIRETDQRVDEDKSKTKTKQQ